MKRSHARIDQVSLGYRTVRLLSAAELTSAQAGYGGAGWSPEWLVVAEEDELGDPIFTDIEAEPLPVFTAEHGAGVWEPIQIADSFDSFVSALAQIASVAGGRQHPVGLEANPLANAERERVLGNIRAANPSSDSEFWVSWLDA